MNASLFRMALGEAGIQAWLTTEHLAGVAPHLGLAVGVLVACARDEPEALAWSQQRARSASPRRRFSTVLPGRRRP